MLQPDGSIVAVGSGRERFALARYETDGDLDTSFDGDGRVTTQFFGLNIESAYGIALQPDGMLVVAGRVFTESRGDFAIARYTSLGTLDVGFGGGDGLVTTDFPETIANGNECPGGQPNCSDDIATDVALQANGRVVAIGSGGPCTPSCVSLLARFEGFVVNDVTPPVITVPPGIVANAGARGCIGLRDRSVGGR